MDALNIEIVEVAPDDPRLEPLIASHLTLMRASSPACSVHAMDASDLASGGARMFAVFGPGEALLAIGAIKPVSDDEIELKSMHVAASARDRDVVETLCEVSEDVV